MLNALLCVGLYLGAPVPDLYARAAAAGVEVLVDDRLNGSGAIVTPAGLIVTAAHVVPDRSRRIEVRSPSLGRVRVGVVAADRGNDVAILRLPTQEAPYAALPVRDAPPQPTESLWLFGTPIYRHQVLLHGRVARAEATYEYLPDRQYYLRIFHLSAPSPPGTSGGAWLDDQGRLAGIQSGLMHDGGSAVGIAYMVPNDAVRAILASGRDGDTATLGVGLEELWEQNEALLRRYPPKTEGLVIARIREDGPAARLGLKAETLITHVDGVAVSLRDEIVGRIRAHAPGDTVVLTVWPGGEKPRDVAVKLARLESLP